MGFYDRVAISRLIRWTAFPNKATARRDIDALMSLPFDRMIVGHGDPIVEDARETLSAAYDWLA